VPLDPGSIRRAPAPDPKKLIHSPVDGQQPLKKVAEGAKPSEPRDYHRPTNRARDDRGATNAGARRRHGTTSPYAGGARRGLFSASDGAFYVPSTPIRGRRRARETPKQALLAALAPILTSPAIRRTGQNTKYDWLVFASNGLPLPPPDFDTMIASYCVAGTSRRHGIDELALVDFDLKKIPTSELIGTGKNQVTMDQSDRERGIRFEDADVAWRLQEVLAKEPRRPARKALPRLRCRRPCARGDGGCDPPRHGVLARSPWPRTAT
jgi:hypothetical protein